MLKIFVSFLIFLPVLLFAEDRVWIYFRDKGPVLSKNTAQLAQSQLSQRAVDRRNLRAAAPVFDFSDIPLYEDYIRNLAKMGVKVHMRSKWLNAVSVYLNGIDKQLIRNLSFVRDVMPVKSQRYRRPQEEYSGTLPKNVESDYGPSDNQNRMIGVTSAHALGFTGEGVRIALFDTGFLLEHESLQHLNIIGTYDFVQGDAVVENQAGDFSNQHNHGTLVLSAIGGYKPGRLIGPAYSAEYVLAKTEDVSSETKVEEDNWVAAAEWADSLGVDIISTSLGYSIFDAGETDYSYADMDGDTAIITKAADLAVKKGILVFASAGNEGNSSWYYITAPADGDSVIAMGAVQSDGSRVSFSSHGPTADGRIKPDLMAQGAGVYCASPNTVDQYTGASGTSLSCPLGAGAAALLLSVNPGLNPMQVRDILHSTATRAQNPDNDYGYGIIDLDKALLSLQEEPVANINSFVVDTRPGRNIIQWISIAQVKVAFWIVRRSNDQTGTQEVGRIAGSEFDLSSRILTIADAELNGGDVYMYTLSALYTDGREEVLDSENVISRPATGIALLQSFPNPFNNTTRISFSLDQSAVVSLTVYDARGRRVKNLLKDEPKDARFHHMIWDGSSDNGTSLASGIYFAVFDAPGKTQIIKLMLIR